MDLPLPLPPNEKINFNNELFFPNAEVRDYFSELRIGMKIQI